MEKSLFLMIFRYYKSFKEDFGKIVGLIYIFEGTGSLDYIYIRLADADGQVVFKDGF